MSQVSANKKVPKQNKNKTKNKRKTTSANPQRVNQKVSAPVASAFVRTVREPRFTRSARNGDVVVDHEEFIQEVSGSLGFANTAIPINPGLITTFPWLGQMAPLYESYCFEKLEFLYQSEAATTATGSVMLAVDYDASDAPAASKPQLATYRGFIRSPPWQACTNRSIAEDLKKRKSYYIRSGTLAANQDIKLYDTGFLNLATSNQASTAIVGELYVRYRVRLMTPQIQDDGLGLARSGQLTGTTAASVPTLTGNTPLTVTGTTGNFTLTASAPYQCLLAARITGTGVTTVAITGSTASTLDPFAITNTGNTNYSYTVQVRFAAGQVFTLTTTNTTIASLVLEIGQDAFVA